jgi:hypothetical protein
LNKEKDKSKIIFQVYCNWCRKRERFYEDFSTNKARCEGCDLTEMEAIYKYLSNVGAETVSTNGLEMETE